MQHYEFDIDLNCEKKRLDLFLTEVQSEITRSYVKKLIDGGHAAVNGTPAKPNTRLKTGDRVEWSIPDPEPLEVKAEAIPLDVVFEDDCMIVVNKPPGMVVHPAPGHHSGTLVNALLAHCRDLPGIGGVERPGIVHRLDKDTSGLVMAAKTETALAGLSKQFKDRDIKKVYLALVKGRLAKRQGTIDTAIGRHPHHRKKMSADNTKGRTAQTRYEVIEQFDKFAYLSISPRTGRTHQIRVHLASIGHPILGDALYGGTQGPGLPKMARQALHAHRIRFMHPILEKEVTLTAPLSAPLERLLTLLREHHADD